MTSTYTEMVVDSSPSGRTKSVDYCSSIPAGMGQYSYIICFMFLRPMFARISLALLIPALLVVSAVPLVASGQTVDELRQQIAELFQRIQALQAEIDRTAQSGQGTNTGTGSTGSIGSGTTTAGGACVAISRGLDIGSRGSDVAELQRFLRSTGDFTYPEITGYFGSVTQAAVQRWQAREGIVSSGTPASTGYGRVGPQTRRALANCTGESVPSQVGGLLRITPVSGSAPLTVTATATVNTARSCQRSTYTIDFGDGSAPFQLTVPANRCQELSQDITHTYQNPGTYTAVLSIGTHRTEVRVTVGGSGSNTGNTGNTGNTAGTGNPSTNFSVSPENGQAPLSAVARFNLRPGDPYEIDWGDGSTPASSGSFNQRDPLPVDGTFFTQAFETRTISHTYQQNGTHTITLKVGRYEQVGNQWLWRTRFFTDQVTISGGSSGSGNNQDDRLTADDRSGDAPHTVEYNVRVGSNASCDAGSYTLEFGDGERTELSYSDNNCNSQTFIVTHRFDDPGTYTTRLYNGSPTEVDNGNAADIKRTTITVSGSSQSSVDHGDFSIAAGIDNNPQKVRVTFGINGSACTSYRLSWGDNASDETHDAGSSTTCTNDSTTKTFTHTYSGTGSYTISLKRQRGSLGNLSSATAETATLTISN